MHIDIQREGGIPISKQIYVALADRIASGLLAPGTQLPSVRQLAKDLQVSHVTLVQAYKLLASNGYVKLIQGKGTFVHTQTEHAIEEPASSYDWQLAIEDYLPRAQFAPFHITKTNIHLSSAMIDPKLLPNRFFQEQIERVFAAEPELLSLFSDIQGDEALREAMRTYLKEIGVNDRASDILVTNGLQQGIDLVARAFISTGDIVIMEEPTYAGAIDLFRGRGATILTVPVDEHGMKIDVLQKICTQYRPKIIFTNPTFQNPTGTVLSFKRRKQLLQLAEHMQCLIVEDDPWSELYFDKKPPISLKSLDQNGHVIYLKGLSKIYAPSCRIGILSASGSVFKRLLAAKANADLGNSLLTQKAILPLLESKRMTEHTKKLRTALKLRRDLVHDLLTKYAPPTVSWCTPPGGVNFWITLPNSLDFKQLLMEAQKNSLSFLPGETCFIDRTPNNHLRISFSFANEALLQIGIPLLCKLIKETST